MKIKCITLTVLLLLITSSGYGQDEYEIKTLSGIKGVYVSIEYLHPEIEAAGLRKDQIQTDVELKLRLAGIKALTLEEYSKEPGLPYLYVNVNSYQNEGMYVFSITVELKQNVSLSRDPSITAYGASTWNTGSVGLVGANNVNQIRDEVKNHVDKFINDYLSVNPK